ncbi:MAG: cytoplasmic protein [Thermodesulfobacteriota bacterium]
MTRKEILTKSPLREVIPGEAEPCAPGTLGAVIARAGVGKTSVLAQIAINGLLDEKNVLHVSLNDPVRKVCLWYEEVFNHLAARYRFAQTVDLWETVLKNRFIMTFRAEGFSVPRLSERINDLTEQGVFYPQIVVMDGIPVDNRLEQTVAALSTLAAENNLCLWLSLRADKDDDMAATGWPKSLASLSSHFFLALKLAPANGKVIVSTLAPNQPQQNPDLTLDPATMLVVKA